jgi:ubiquinol oxidase
MVAYFEEEAVVSYTDYLAQIDAGNGGKRARPEDRHRLLEPCPPDARLRDVMIAVRADEAGHRDANHGFADSFRTPAMTKHSQTAV